MSTILSTIGNTPLITVDGIFAKLETTNPTGSIKDRMAWFMVRRAEERGELRKGDEIIEITSGNTGIALAMISAVRGYKFTAVMPESMSVERQKMIRAFGATIVLTPAEEDMAGAVKKYHELVAENPKAWLPNQFENPDNFIAHMEGVGKEIIGQMHEDIDAFVTGAGTGGTLIGAARALKEAGIKAKIIAVEPAESAVLSGKEPGLHLIQGIGEGFVPKLLKENMHLVDEVIEINSHDAVEMSERLAREYGLLVGISSGANLLAAMEAHKKFRNVVTVLPDRGERYLSTR
ncbi:MAG: cysteine synthase A [Candidatus Peribacteraceae bacterium]|nr:cysteine synthase A [Candidatus Peribacteraceae bacterium]